METKVVQIMAVVMVFAFPSALLADTPFARADLLFSSRTPARVLEAATLYAHISDDHPESYEAAWKASRAYRQYCLDMEDTPAGTGGEVSRTFGKLGMKYGARAISLAPGRVEGNFWYACSVAFYAREAGSVAALREGLKDKAQKALERAYTINRLYDGGGPVIALGRFWYVLPWPFYDSKKSLAYLREYQRLFPHDPEGQVYLAELLMEMGRKAEAHALLKKAAASGASHFCRRAAALLAKS